MRSPSECTLRHGPGWVAKLFKPLTIFGKMSCCSKVIMSGVNSNVIMSGYGDENPDDEGREAVRDYTKSVSRRVNDGEGIVGAGSQ